MKILRNEVLLLIITIILFFTFPFTVYSESGIDAQDIHILIGSDIDYYPMSFMQDGSAAGFDLDLLNTISLETGITIENRLDHWTDVLSALRQGDIDAISGILRTPERVEWFDFTIPYRVEYYTIFAHTDSGITGASDLPAKLLIVLEGDAIIESYIKPHGLYPYKSTTLSYTEAFKTIVQGEADYTIAPYGFGQQLLSEHEQDDPWPIAPVGRALIPVEYRFAVQKGNSDLLFLLNEEIADLRASGRLAALQSGWNVQDSFQVSSPLSTPKLLVALVWGGLICGAFYLLWLLAVRIGVYKKTDEISGEAALLQGVLDSLPLAVCWNDTINEKKGSNRLYKKLETSEPINLPKLHDDHNDGTDGDDGDGGDATDLNTGKSKFVQCRRKGNNNEQTWYEYTKYHIKDDTNHSHQEAAKGILYVYRDCSLEYKQREEMRILKDELAESTTAMHEQKVVDTLSGLFLRNHLQERVEAEAALFQRYNQPVAFIVVDIDNLATLNREYGYTAGDSAISTVATTLKNCLRQVDIAGRLTGGFFLVLLPHTGINNAQKAAEKIVHQIKVLPAMNYSLSITCAAIEYSGQTWDSLLSEIEHLIKNKQQKQHYHHDKQVVIT